MNLKSRYFDEAKEIIDQRRFAAESAAEDKKKKLYGSVPGLEELDRKISGAAMSIIDEINKGPFEIEKRINEVKDQNKSLQKKREELLASYGYGSDATDPDYSCKICSDTGYVGLKMCSCLKKEISRIAMKSAGLDKLFEKENFDSFDIKYYESREEREIALNTLEKCREFADSFGDETYSNIMIVGGTGLGKTHLSTAIAGAVIEKGYDVVYVTSQNMIEEFEKEKFEKDQDTSTDRFFECDLLIIDDLGSEVRTSLTMPFIYNIVNTRINNSKSTIINTNLSHREVSTYYGDRVASRIFGEYLVLGLKGKDIRYKKLGEQE